MAVDIRQLMAVPEVVAVVLVQISTMAAVAAVIRGEAVLVPTGEVADLLHGIAVGVMPVVEVVVPVVQAKTPQAAEVLAMVVMDVPVHSLEVLMQAAAAAELIRQEMVVRAVLVMVVKIRMQVVQLLIVVAAAVVPVVVMAEMVVQAEYRFVIIHL